MTIEQLFTPIQYSVKQNAVPNESVDFTIGGGPIALHEKYTGNYAPVIAVAAIVIVVTALVYIATK